jgi:ClpP class serine protease
LSIKAGSAQFQLPTIPVFGRPLTPYQTEELQGMIKDFYQDFVQKVADDRGKSWDEIHAVAEGRVWSGPRAQERGLVDGQGGLQDAIRIAMHRAGLKEENVKVREVHPDLSFQDLMLLMGGMGQGMSLKGSMDHMLADRLNFSQDLRVQILGSGKPELLMDDQILGVQPR